MRNASAVIVVDASALLEVLLNAPAASEIAVRLSNAAGGLHAPHLIDLEVLQVIRRLSLASRLSPAVAVTAVTGLGEFPLTRHSHELLLHRIWELRHNLTAYDAAYISLAEFLDAPLLTRDARLAASTGHQAAIELI